MVMQHLAAITADRLLVIRRRMEEVVMAMVHLRRTEGMAMGPLPATLTTTDRRLDTEDILPARMDRHQATAMVTTVLHQVIGIEGLRPATGVHRLGTGVRRLVTAAPTVVATVGAAGVVAAVGRWTGVGSMAHAVIPTSALF